MKYVALLRGIGPGTRNMQNDKLRGVFEALGFTNVQSVISSGNIVFESDLSDVAAMEKQIEAAWPAMLGFTSTTIIRSQKQVESLMNKAPFNDLAHEERSYLMVTFFQKPQKIPFKIPHHPKGKSYYFPYATQLELCSVTDNTIVKTSDIMTYIEKQFGKDITSRSYLTVQRILKKMTGV